MQPTARIAILRTGTHTSVDGRKLTVTPEMLRELAEGYDPTASEAPLVVGHPSLDAPAYGWTSQLRIKDGLLFAEPRQVHPEFAEMVNAGRFKNVSASIYLPTSPGNPKPGTHYLKHVGFLGAAAPAVKGLPQVQFADGGDAMEFAAPLGAVGSILGDLFRRLREHLIERDGLEKADQVIPAWQIGSLQEIADRDTTGPSLAFAAEGGTQLEPTMSTAAPAAVAAPVDLAARTAELDTRNAEITAREHAIAAREVSALREQAIAFAQKLVDEGKLLPREKDHAVDLLMAVQSIEISFAEGDATVKKPAGDLLRQILTDMKPKVDFSEKSAGAVVGGPVSFAAPSMYTVDPARLEVHNKALAHIAKNPTVAYLDAVKAVSG